jgi:hypothetical protein
MANLRRNRKETRGSMTLEDPGMAQVLLFVGWIPPAVTALVGGVVLGLRTGSVGTLAVVAICGTLVGYIASLTVLFTLGRYLELRRVRGRLATAFLVLDVAVGVAGAIAIAILASTSIGLALQLTALTIGFVLVVIIVLVVDEARSGP